MWRIGTPDLIVKTKDILVKGDAPDWWGEIDAVQIPLDEDRYVLAVEVKEVNDVDVHNKDRQTVGGRYVWHHLIYRTQVGLETPSDTRTDCRQRQRRELAGARSGSQPRLLRSEGLPCS